MTTVRESLSQVAEKRLEEITDDTLIANLLPKEGASQVQFIDKLGSLCGVELKPSDLAGLTKVVELETLIQYKRYLEGIRVPSVGNEYYSAAVSLYAHYSTVRASLATALLTISAGFSTYLLRYVQESTTAGLNPSPSLVRFLFSIQLAFSIAAFFASTWLAGLRQRTQNFLLSLEAGKKWGSSKNPFNPQETVLDRYFHYLIDPTLGGMRKFQPRDWLDWFLLLVVIAIQVGVFSASGVYLCGLDDAP